MSNESNSFGLREISRCKVCKAQRDNGGVGGITLAKASLCAGNATCWCASGGPRVSLCLASLHSAYAHHHHDNPAPLLLSPYTSALRSTSTAFWNQKFLCIPPRSCTSFGRPTLLSIKTNGMQNAPPHSDIAMFAAPFAHTLSQIPLCHLCIFVR